MGERPAPAGASPVPDVAEIDRFLAGGLDATGLPGMAVAVTHGADVVHVAGYGTDGRGDPVTPRTPFRIASLSKSFTAVAVHQLAEAGRIDLDAPVDTQLPGFATADPAVSTRITVTTLLDQTSGLADAGYPGITGDRPADLAERIASLHGARPVSEPGREFHYFDPNYQVLARLVEVVSGRPFGTYLAQRVLSPLGMTSTVAAPTARAATAAVPALAPGHILVFGVPVARAELDGLLAGSGGVVSTAEDMARWLVLQAGSGAPLLTSASMSRMHTPPPGVAGGYAQGWQVSAPEEGPRRIQHTGVLSTFSAVQVLLPESGYGFALLFDGNSAVADTAGLSAGLASRFAGGPPTGVRSTGVVALVLAVLTATVLVWRVRLLLRVPRWARHRAGRPWWVAVPGLAWPLLPVTLLLGMRALVEVLVGRSFTRWQLCLAMPDVMVLVAVGAVTGSALVTARPIGLGRGAGTSGSPR